MGAAKQRGAFSASDATGAQARGICQCEPLAIMRVKSLDFERGAVDLREQGNAAVGHRAVYVHEEQLDLCGTLFEGGRDFGNTCQRSLREKP